MHIIGAIIIGFIVGLVARAVTPGKGPSGIVITTLLGIVGAVVGTFIGKFLGLYQEGEPAGFIMSVVGAALLLVLARAVSGGRAKP